MSTLWIEYTVNTDFSFFQVIILFLAPDDSNLFQFPLEVRVIGSQLYLKNNVWGPVSWCN